NNKHIKIYIRFENNILSVYSDLSHHHHHEDKFKYKFNQNQYFIQNLFKKNHPLHHSLPNLCLSISKFKYNLNTTLNNHYHLFISSLTGQLSDNHDLLLFQTKYLYKNSFNLNNIKNNPNKFNIIRQHYISKKGNIFILILWTFVCIISLLLL